MAERWIDAPHHSRARTGDDRTDLPSGAVRARASAELPAPSVEMRIVVLQALFEC
jgi:hypothetical protein